MGRHAEGDRGGESGEEIAFATKSITLGFDDDGDKITSIIIDWNVTPTETANTEKAKSWPKSLRLLHRIMMNILADCGVDMKPWADGPTVAASITRSSEPNSKNRTQSTAIPKKAPRRSPQSLQYRN